MQQSLAPKPYIAMRGDTITSIAKQFGFANWRDIYDSPANAGLRALRPNPDQIQVGDRIMIPPTPQIVQQVLQGKLNNLTQLRYETDALYQRIEDDMDANIGRYENIARNADAAATVANILVGLGTIVFRGMAAMSLSGSALAKANSELAKDSLKLAADPLEDATLSYTASQIGANNGILWAVGKTTIQSWLNINSPAWWAGVVGNLQDGKSWSDAVTSNPLDALRAVKDRIDGQRLDTLNRIDQKIRETRAQLNGVSTGGLTSIYDNGQRRYA